MVEGPKKGGADRRKLEDFWYFLQEHTLFEGVISVLRRVITRVRATGARRWIWFLWVTTVLNLLGVFYAQTPQRLPELLDFGSPPAKPEGFLFD